MKPAVILPLALVLLFLMVAPAYAGPPVVVTTEYEVDYAIYDNTLCPGIVVMDREVYTQRLTFYYDKDGNTTKILLHGDGYDNLYNADNPNDIVLSAHFTANGELDPATFDIVKITGAPYHFVSPGYGTVLLRAGRWELSYPDGQVAGKNSYNDPKDIAQFCSLFVSN